MIQILCDETLGLHLRVSKMFFNVYRKGQFRLRRLPRDKLMEVSRLSREEIADLLPTSLGSRRLSPWR